MKTLDVTERARRTDKVARSWANQAQRYDKSIGFFERRVFGRSHRRWACSRASGDVLEVAVDTALNLAHFPEHAKITGLDLSPEMLEIPRQRAADLGRDIELKQGDAHQLPFPDDSFDAVVCTYSLCNIPDPQLAVSEMKRVLRPGGRLILVDHIRSDVMPVYWFQKLVEFFSKRLEGEHMTRRPAAELESFEIAERDERTGPAGVIERLVAINK